MARQSLGYPHLASADIARPTAAFQFCSECNLDEVLREAREAVFKCFLAGMEPGIDPALPIYSKQITNLRRPHFWRECGIWETAFAVESGYRFTNGAALASQNEALRDKWEATRAQELEIDDEKVFAWYGCFGCIGRSRFGR
jgi:hypothetical protein